MTPEAITALVLQMKPKHIGGKENKTIWMIRKAAELGMQSAYTSILENVTIKTNWK